MTASPKVVRANCYYLDQKMETLNLPVEHVGVEVGGYEWSYSKNGVLVYTPKKCAPRVFRESIIVGTTSGADVVPLFDAMAASEEWHGSL